MLIVNTVEQFGLQAPDEKEVRVPDGSPAIEKEIGWLFPEVKPAVIVFVVEDAALTDLSPALDSEKSNVVGVDEGVEAGVPLDVVTTVWLWPSMKVITRV